MYYYFMLSVILFQSQTVSRDECCGMIKLTK